jgi:hypothetical protein
MLIVITDTETGCGDQILDNRKSATFDLEGVRRAIHAMLVESEADAAPKLEEIKGIHFHHREGESVAVFIIELSWCSMYGVIHNRYNTTHVIKNASFILED